MASKVEFIKSILTKQLIWATEDIDLSKRPSVVFQDEQCIEWMDEVLDDLDFRGSSYPEQMSLPTLQIEDAYLVFYDCSSFNRYKNCTLRSSLYEYYSVVPVQNYRRFSRNNESKCLAAGLAGKKWTSPLAESFFEKSQAPGDLGLSGSASWKLKAFQEFLFDLYAYKKKLKTVRIAIYDVVMINNKLTPIDQLLLSQNEQSAKYLWNYLQRVLQR